MTICDRISLLLHRRAELTDVQRGTLEAHLRGCRRCRLALVEIERVEDLLVSWEAPAPGDGFAESVLASIEGREPQATCEETAAEVHHLISGDVEPWRASRIEAHLEHCQRCAEAHAGAVDSRRRWLDWAAPEPPITFANRVIARIRAAAGETSSESAPEHDRPRPWLFAEVRVPRLAAALVIVALSLALGNLVFAPPPGARDANRPAESSAAVERHAPAPDPHPPTPMMLELFATRPGRFDVADSFSNRIEPARGKLLRDART